MLGITFIRFRQATKSTKSAVSSNHIVHMRAQRTRRRLYLMVLSILTPYLPIVIAIAAVNVMNIGPVMPFSYNTIHHHDSPYPWNTILFLTSAEAGFEVVNNVWIPILTGIPVFIFFGMTKEAMNDYRKMLLFFRMGKLFPKLRQEYDPDRSLYSGTSVSWSVPKSTGQTTTTTCSEESGKPPCLPSTKFLSSPGFNIDLESFCTQENSTRSITEIISDQPPVQIPQPAVLSSSDFEYSTGRSHRNPFLFRTTLNFPTAYFRLPHFLHLSRPLKTSPQTSTQPWEAGHGSAIVQTRVWSQDSEVNPSEIEEGVLVEMKVERESSRAGEKSHN